jgi:flagellar basal-body rod modification protein FlgD
LSNTYAVWNARPPGSTLPVAGSGTAGQLGKQDFLDLLAAQLRMQNPLEPLDNADFMAQTAQFNTLEQLQQMNESLTAVLGLSALSQASGLIGRHVVAVGPDDTTIEGVVTEVALQDGSPVLLVGETVVPIDQVVIISEAPDA